MSRAPKPDFRLIAELRGHADAARHMPPWPPAKYNAEEKAAWMRGWRLATASIREYLGVSHADIATWEQT